LILEKKEKMETKQIESIIDSYIKDFIKSVLVENKDLFIDVFLEEEILEKFLKDWDIYKKGSMKKQVIKSKAGIKSKTSTEENSCPHILISGKNIGKKCGVKKICENGFCTRHKNSSVLNKFLPERIVKKHIYLKKWWNPTTKFVFKSKDDLTVIGKTTKLNVSGGKCIIHPLNEEDIKLCKKIGYSLEEEKIKVSKTKPKTKEKIIKKEAKNKTTKKTKSEIDETKSEIEEADETKSEINETKGEIEEADETKSEIEEADETNGEINETKGEIEDADETKSEINETKGEIDETKSEIEEAGIEEADETESLKSEYHNSLSEKIDNILNGDLEETLKEIKISSSSDDEILSDE
jgi:hypothetical protein